VGCPLEYVDGWGKEEGKRGEKVPEIATPANV